MKLPHSLCPELYIPDEQQIAELQEELNRIVFFQYSLDKLTHVYEWCRENNIEIRLRNHWSVDDQGGWASFELLPETFTEQNKMLFLLKWS